jgi:hypothetical protein
MTYESLIQTVSEIVDNPNIEKNGLVLVYELPENIHNQMNEELFYTLKQGVIFVPSDIFEIEIEGILIRFKKVKNDI